MECRETPALAGKAPEPGSGACDGKARAILPATAGEGRPDRPDMVRIVVRRLGAESHQQGVTDQAGTAGCSTARTVKSCSRPSRVTQVIDWPADRPISAVPIGVSTEILSCAMSASPG